MKRRDKKTWNNGIIRDSKGRYVKGTVAYNKGKKHSEKGRKNIKKGMEKWWNENKDSKVVKEIEK